MENTEQFIITDPCYIMDKKQYEKICDEGCDFEGQDFPLESKHCDNGKKITILEIKGTPSGDGSFNYDGQEIGVDSGMLCVAYCEEGWEGETLGATFESRTLASGIFEEILEQF